MTDGRKPHPEMARFMEGLALRNPGEEEFHQAVREVAEALLPYIDRHSPLPGVPDPRAHDRAGPHRLIPRLLAGRRRRDPVSTAATACR